MLTANRTFNRPINTNTFDFIMNEVLVWLIEQMESSPLMFESYVYDNGGTIQFYNEHRVSIRIERTGSVERVNKFIVMQDNIFEYHIVDCHYADNIQFKNALEMGWYKKYAISGASIDGTWVSLGMSKFRDLILKKKVWKQLIKDGTYLKRDITLQKVTVNDVELGFSEVDHLSSRIINSFKKDFLYKNFIAGTPKEKLKAKLANRSLKNDLSIKMVTNFLESTNVTNETTRPDNSGPWATTGTSEFIDTFDISKLLRAHPTAGKFIMSNMDAIFKELKKKKYSHSLGYYTFKNGWLDNNCLKINASSTTYYN